MQPLSIRPIVERACYTIVELRQLLGLGRTAVYKALSDGTIPNIRIGRKFVVPKAAVARMLESVPGGSGIGADYGRFKALQVFGMNYPGIPDSCTESECGGLLRREKDFEA